MELLFFDTFSHENNEELNLDLVQFPSPVCIYEVRIIPLGSRVEADFPGGVRLGATNPSSFPLEFFVNDLSKAGASNFAKLGSLDYKQNVDIQLIPNSKIPTDGLVLRGLYSTLTLAVFGVLTKVVKEKSPSPPPPPPRIQACLKVMEILLNVIDPNLQIKQSVEWHLHEAQRQPEHTGLPVSEVHPPISYVDAQSAVSYSVEQYTQDPSYIPPASVYPEQAAEYHSAPPEYTHSAQYPDPNWQQPTVQPPVYSSTESTVYQPAEDSYNQEIRHRSRDSVRDYHRDRHSRSSSRDRDYRDYKDKDSDYNHDSYHRDHEDRHYRDRHKRSSFRRSKEREGRRPRSRTPESIHRDKRPHSPPPLSSTRTPSPHSRVRNSPSYTPPPPDDRERKMKDKEDSSHVRSKITEPWKDDKREPPSPKASDHSDLDGADNENDGFEEILSEEEGMFDLDEVIDMGGEDYEGDETWNYMPNFNPYQYEINKLSHFKGKFQIQCNAKMILSLQYFFNPKLTEFEIEKKHFKNCPQDELPENAVKILELSKQLDEIEKNEKWVEGIETMSASIPKGLAFLEYKKHKDLFEKLISWTCHALDYEKALCQSQPVFKLRHLKAGIKLATSLLSCDADIVKKLCDENIPDKLLDLFTVENMAMSIKLLILKSVDALTNNEIGITYFCKGKNDNSRETCYQSLVKMMLSDQVVRVMVAIKALLRKIHLFELLCKLKRTVIRIVSKNDEDGMNSDENIGKLNENNIEDIITAIVEIKSVMQATHLLIEEMQDSGPNDDTETQQLGLQISYYLYTLQLIDNLMNFHKQGITQKELDNPDVISILHDLYLLVFTPIGRSAVITVLGNSKNLEAILPFVESVGDNEDSKIRRSVTYGYACDLLLLTLRSSSSISMLQLFSQRLLNILMEEPSSKLNEIAQWMSPIKTVTKYSAADVESLMNIIKRCSENVTKVSPELVTSLRILQYLCIAPDENVSENDKQEELRYKFSIIQVFANDGLSIFTSLLQKFCSDNTSITNDLSHLIGHAGIMLTSAILPLCMLIRSMLSYLIYSRSTEFKDLTAIPTVLEAFHFLSMIPVSSPHQPDIQKIQKILIETLLAYTQPILSQALESDEAISKSLWTQMVMEVLKFIQKAPRTFVTGLNILSELLPVPLPIQTREALTQEEITKAINIRKLWCAHLHPLSLDLQQLISNLCGTSCQILQHALRRVCFQLADLAAPTSITVVKAILTTFVENSISYSETTVDDVDFVVNDQISRILNLLVYLMSNSAIKVTMLHLLNGGFRLADEKSPELSTHMLNIVTFKSSKQAHIQVQECILSIYQSLCDSEITLMSSDTGLSVQEQLSNTIPPKDQLNQIYTALVDILGRDRQDLSNDYTSLLLSLRIMQLLTEHDYGFYHLKISLEETNETMYKLLNQLSDCFSKEVTEFIALMSVLLELLRQLTSVDDDITTVMMPRAMCMSIAELANLLKWAPSKNDGESSDNVPHPLITIQKQINDCISEEDGLDGLQDNVSLLIQLLNESSCKENEEKDEMTEPILPSPDNVSNQFGARATFMIADSDDDRLSPSYWFCQPSLEESEYDADQNVELDLTGMSEKLCPGLNLKGALEKAYMPNEIFASKTDSNEKKPPTSTSRPIGKKRYQPFINPGKRDFASGSRGRGFSRGGLLHSRLNDPFRSRPPNTSRPPSMHVDDFVALEKNQSGSASSGGSGSNNNNCSQPSKRAAKYKPTGSGSSQKGIARDFYFVTASNSALRGNGRGSNLRGGNRAVPKNLQSSKTFSRSNYEPRPSNARSRDIYSTGWMKPRNGNNRPASNYWLENQARFGSAGNRGRREPNLRHSRTATR
ncbi:Protein virilizer [Nymphon striatum]|nr:Protein virilizer [Nymphon striatum]